MRILYILLLYQILLESIHYNQLFHKYWFPCCKTIFEKMPDKLHPLEVFRYKSCFVIRNLLNNRQG